MAEQNGNAVAGTRVRTSSNSSAGRDARRTRTQRPFPAAAFQDALEIADTILKIGGQQTRIRRLTIFENLRKSPDSGPSKMMVTVSGQYGLTSGSYAAEYLLLTEKGRIAIDPEAPPPDQLRARFDLAVAGIELFSKIYEQYKGAKLPAKSVLRDFLREEGVDTRWWDECIDIFIVNCKYLGLLKDIAGSERLISIEHALEDLAREGSAIQRPSGPSQSPAGSQQGSSTQDTWQSICFYITPIGDLGSEERKHADLFSGSLIEPAIEPLGMKVVRADQIGEPGMIATQIMQHLRHAKLVIADMSLRNPNVFYEMALRHAARRPIVQIIRKADKLPFDLNQVRTVVIDTTDIYALVPKLEVIRAEISTQARKAIEDPDSVSNPLTVFYPPFFEADPKPTSKNPAATSTEEADGLKKT
jgi:hypothetical protein